MIHDALVEWLNRGWRSLGKSLARDGLTQRIHDAQERPNKTAQRAWDALWTRRRQRPLLTFKNDRISGGGELLTRILQNIEPQGTDATTLVLLVRLLSSDESSRSTVFRFVQQYYPKEQSDGLHDEEEFKTLWQRKTPKEYFAPALEEYLDLAIEAHDFIHSSLPDIMGKPVKSYIINGGDITFQLDFTHYSEAMNGLQPVQYQLDCMTRVITSSEGRGVLHLSLIHI